MRTAVIAAMHDAGYLYIPEGRRDHVHPIDALHLHGLMDRETDESQLRRIPVVVRG